MSLVLPPPHGSAAQGLVSHGQWARLHPLSPLVRFGRGLLSLVVVVGALSHDQRSLPQVLLFMALVLLGTITSVVSWLVTRWRIGEGDLQIESGLLRRQSVRFPLDRIQAVDVIAPLSARMFGLAEVRVVIAGRGSEHGALAYLTLAEATRLRGELLALAHGLSREMPEPPAMPLALLSNQRFIVALLISGPPLFGLLLILAVIVLVSVYPRAAPGAAVVVPVLFTITTLMWRSLNNDYNFSLREAPDGLRIDRGLLQTRGETIPFGRIQGVRIVQPFTWRFAGWYRLEVDVARQRRSREGDRDEGRFTRSLFPVGTEMEASWLLSRVFPGARKDPPPGSGVPTRALWRAPLSQRFFAAWHDEWYVAARTGRVRPAVVIVPLEKMQSLRLRSGPWLRALRLASVHVDTAGSRWQAAARCRDATEADALMAQLSEGARARRQLQREAVAANRTQPGPPEHLEEPAPQATGPPVN